MSGDLISRSATIENIWSLFNSVYNDSAKFETEETVLARRILVDVQREIERQNTTYDAEKVIQHLEENKEDAIKAIEENSPSEFHMIKIRDLKELFEEYTREQIEIVKSGGITVGQKGERE